MASTEVVETVYGRYNKYEIVRESGGILGRPKFQIYRDGKYYRGAFSTLKDAVEAAKDEG